MKAILLAVGDELTSGQTLDTNSAWLAQELARVGVAVLEHHTVRDVRSAIAQALQRACERAEIVLVTGGLGPTPDDLTRQALADAMGVKLILDEPSLQVIESFFLRRGRQMIPENRVQATFPEGSRPLPNPIGTAPGIAARLGGAMVFVMPGVPREMKKMYTEHVRTKLPHQKGAILFSQVHVADRGESDVGAIIADLMVREGDVVVGTTASGGQVTIRITARGNGVADAESKCVQVAAEIRRRLGRDVVGEGDVTLASVVGVLLKRKGQTLSTAESCTGGMLGQMLTDVSGASEFFRGGIVAYDNTVKHALLGVDEALLNEHGAVSEPVARAMAEGCRARLGSDWAISVTGIAGPTGGTDQKPVGTVYIGLAGPGGTEVQLRNLPGERAQVRLRTAMAALNMLRLRLLETR